MTDFLSLVDRHRFFLVLALSLGIAATVINETQLLQGWQHNLGVKLARRPNTDDIVVVAIDEYSLEKLGRWPWSRNIHAQLIRKLTAARVKAIGMDIFFMEPEQDNPDADQALAEAIRDNGKVALPIILDASRTIDRQMILPLPQLAEVANLGFVNLQLETDGVLRGIHLQAETAGRRFYSLAQTLLLTANSPFSGKYPPLPEQRAQLLDMHEFRMIMSFPADDEHFQQVSYWDVLTHEATQQNLQGKLVLVGVTAAGLAPHFATPALTASRMMSGVEYNANAVAALNSGLVAKPLNRGWRILITFCSVFFPVLLFGFLSAPKRLVYLAIFSGLSLLLSWLLFSGFAIWYAPFVAILMQIMSYPFWGWHHQRQISDDLRQEKEQANTLLHAVGDAVITTDARGIIQFMNPVAELITGYSLMQAQGKAIETVVSLKKDRRGDVFSAIFKLLATDKSVITTKPLALLSQSNQRYAVRITVNAVHSGSGKINAIIFALSDISEIMEVSRKMKHLATHDALTQLPNRTLLEDRLLAAIHTGERHTNQFAVIFVDLDGFKKVNDQQGHGIGDLLLKQVAERLSSQKRKTDTIARWGGDEFVILLENISHEDAVIEIAKNIIKLLSKPFIIEAYELRVSPSIGISVYPKDGQHPSELLEKADAAMYHVKRTGRNNYCFYRDEISENFFNDQG